jgi:hypothetical protein
MILDGIANVIGIVPLVAMHIEILLHTSSHRRSISSLRSRELALEFLGKDATDEPGKGAG